MEKESQNKILQRENYGLFLMGILLGIFGGLTASILNDYFTQYGLAYKIITPLVFLGLFFCMERMLSKRAGLK